MTGGAALAAAGVGGFVGGFSAGMVGGLSSGFVQGFGNASYFGGASFGSAFGSGIQQGVIGGFMGGAMGGLTGGISAKMNGLKFIDGTPKIVSSAAPSVGTLPDPKLKPLEFDFKSKIKNTKWVVDGDDVGFPELKGVKLGNPETNFLNQTRNTIPRTKSVLKHIFDSKPGHVKPSTVLSENRYIRLFEKVANNPNNLVLNPSERLLPLRAAKAGMQVYTQTFRNGKQVWVHVRKGRISDAGVNLIPRK